MEDNQNRLLIGMVDKALEAKTYTNISLALTIIFFIEFFLILFGYAEFDIIYFLILIVTYIGNTHMNKKHKKAIKEYEQLKEEYENTI